MGKALSDPSWRRRSAIALVKALTDPGLVKALSDVEMRTALTDAT